GQQSKLVRACYEFQAAIGARGGIECQPYGDDIVVFSGETGWREGHVLMPGLRRADALWLSPEKYIDDRYPRIAGDGEYAVRQPDIIRYAKEVRFVGMGIAHRPEHPRERRITLLPRYPASGSLRFKHEV